LRCWRHDVRFGWMLRIEFLCERKQVMMEIAERAFRLESCSLLY
jgi:hypothetical protein